MMEFLNLLINFILVGSTVAVLSIVSIMIFALILDESKEIEEDYVMYKNEKIPFNEEDQE